MGYYLDVAANNTFTTFVPGYQNLDVGNTLNKMVSGLNKNTDYYYRLRAYHWDTKTTNSNTVRVKTKNN